MKTSDSIDKLAGDFHAAQMEIKHAIKDSTNPAFRSKYADLGAVWDAIREALHNNGLAVIQMPVHSEDGRVHLTTRLLAAGGQWLEETASIPVTKQDAHGYGSGLTYLRRYSLASMLGVVSDDDDGNAAVEKPKESAAAKWGNSGAEVCSIEFDNLPPDEQTSMRLHGSIVADAVKKGKAGDAFDYIGKQGFTHEEKVALNSLLSPPQRRALKEIQAARDKNYTPAMLGTQA